MSESCLHSEGAAVMPSMLQIATMASRRKCCNSGKDAKNLLVHTVAMAKKAKKGKKPVHFLKEWREYRKMTQEDLAANIKPPTKASVISLIENGERGLSNKWLERLAHALGTKKGYILDVDPNSAGSYFMEVFGQIAEEDRQQALNILETFRRKAG